LISFPVVKNLATVYIHKKLKLARCSIIATEIFPDYLNVMKK